SALAGTARPTPATPHGGLEASPGRSAASDGLAAHRWRERAHPQPAVRGGDRHDLPPMAASVAAADRLGEAGPRAERGRWPLRRRLREPKRLHQRLSPKPRYDPAALLRAARRTCVSKAGIALATLLRTPPLRITADSGISAPPR